jgi:hypothetical protein
MPQTIYFTLFDIECAALRRKIKDWLAQNQDNLSECGASTIQIQLSVLV